jgi:hypothetical protein
MLATTMRIITRVAETEASGRQEEEEDDDDDDDEER